MGHSGGSDECIGCIRGRLAVLGEHDRAVKLQMNHESFARSFGRAADRKVYGPSVVPCLECGAPGVYHATHCGHYQVSQEGGLHGGPEPYRGECGQAMPLGWCRLEKGHLGSHWRPVPTLGMVGQRIQSIKEESAKSGRQHGANMALRVDGQALVIGRIVRYRTVGEPGQTWAAVKLRFFPAWWLARWPAQMRREVVDVNALYPTLQLELPDHATTLVIERFDPFHPVEKW